MCARTLRLFFLIVAFPISYSVVPSSYRTTAGTILTDGVPGKCSPWMQLIESTLKRDCSDKRTFLSSSSLTCDYGELVVLLIVVLALRHAREGAVERANLIRKQSQYEGAIPLILSPHPFLYFGARVRLIDTYQLCFTLPRPHFVSAPTQRPTPMTTIARVWTCFVAVVSPAPIPIATTSPRNSPVVYGEPIGDRTIYVVLSKLCICVLSGLVGSSHFRMHLL